MWSDFHRELTLVVQLVKPFSECQEIRRNCQGLHIFGRISITVEYVFQNLYTCISLLSAYRVTGLDPAGLFFNPKSTAFLTKQDAEFVDVIHTDGGIYGTTAAVASADFYPNDGVRAQSGCSAWTFPFSLTLSGAYAIYFSKPKLIFLTQFLLQIYAVIRDQWLTGARVLRARTERWHFLRRKGYRMMMMIIII